MIKTIFSAYSVLLSTVAVVGTATYVFCRFDNPKDAYDREGAKKSRLIIAVAAVSAVITSFISIMLPE